MKKIMLCLSVLVCVCTACDREKNELRKGNKAFAKSEFKQAEDAYRASLVADSNYAKAEYNLANASYKQGKDDKLHTAAKYYDSFLKSLSPEDTLNRTNGVYNLGNANFKLSQSDTVKNTEQSATYLRKAAEYYKETLRLNPSDSNAKYNLAMTQYLLKKNEQENKNKRQQQNQQQQQQQQNQNNNSQNRNEDSANRDGERKKQNGDSRNGNGEKKNQKQDSQNAQGEKKDKKEVNRMLEALKNNEKNTLNKIKHQKDDKVQKRRVEKDW